MALNPNNYPTDRRASSAKRDNDIQRSEFPIVTQSAYQEAFRKADSMDAKLRSICIARVKIGQALLAVDKALRDTSPQITGNGMDQKIHNKLKGIRVQLEKLFLACPLEVK